ncbi:MAG: hypothetical protein M1839_001706 [Geoglossum umbratile]|nr:MAG: hypothetical protein M1839_001706 [Geoglossum umbratile]
MAGFGRSVSDLALGIKFVMKIGQTLKETGGASEDYQESAEFLRCLELTLRNLERLAAKKPDRKAGGPSLDPAISTALSVLPEACTIQRHGQSGFTSTSKITVTIDGEIKDFFLKTGPTGDMFEGEHTSLQALRATVPTLCPASLTHGQLSNSRDHFLLTEFLDMSPHARSSTSATLAQKLAQLHTAPAPTPAGHATAMFGFPTTTFCGATAQDNTYRASWAEFFAQNRLRAIAAAVVRNQGADGGLVTWVDRVVAEVVPALLREGHLGGEAGIVPVLVHGDLWSGNKAVGRVSGWGGSEDVVFDPSSCYAHSEYELGIMKMFGGFSAAFFDEYHRLVPKTEPVEEYADRVELYELYHHLNHCVLFGGGYRDGAVDIMKKLCRKYGRK